MSGHWVELERLVPTTASVPEYPTPVPSYRVEAAGDELVVWGLTYRMLHAFFAVLDPGWHPPAGSSQ